MTAVVAALLGCIAGLGVLLVVAGVRGVPAQAAPTPEQPSRRLERLNLRVGVAVAAGLAAAVITRWPVAAVAAAVVGASAPSVVGARARRRNEVERIEAIARWAEQLRDTMSAAAGLHEAIGVTARVAPLPIRAHVQDLAVALRRHPLPDALRRFAADLASPAGDQVAVALLLASERHGARLSDVLSRVAEGVRAEATLRLRIEAQRARTYSQARLVSGVIAAVVAIYLVLNRGYLEPFGTPLGQVVLAGVCTLWLGALWALTRLAQMAPAERILGDVAGAPAPGPAGGAPA